MDTVTYWNEVAREADRVTHTPSISDDGDREQGVRGPAGSSRAFAIVHLAMHDAYFTIETDPALGTYLPSPPTPHPMASVDAAIAAAAFSTLSALYPNQNAFFERKYLEFPLPGPGVAEGHAHGVAVANQVLDLRSQDPGTNDDGYVTSPARGRHRPDPVNPRQGFHAPFYGSRSRNFAVTKRFALDPPPALGDQDYLDALREVRAKGISPELMGTLPSGSGPRRTPDETATGLFWAYDGAHEIGTPPRLYNQMIERIATAQHNSLGANARLFALVNAALGDAGILAWNEKFRHDLWRPVVGLREHDLAWGPTGNGGNELDPAADPGWLPMGAPRSNQPNTLNFTPPFPAYPSGHATFGAAFFQSARRFYEVTQNGPDDLANGLQFVSDELNGATVDQDGILRPRHARNFSDGLWEMIEENGRSRVFLGVHWVFDAFAVDENGRPDLNQSIGGVPLGLTIANDIADNGLFASSAAMP